ncbi:dynamin family protein [Rhodococcus sp. NPDC049939]|uniref:dynamin family protein n=1 Tax=Rhodococcus sp. NPDC049939 TaxID=3155511 RepID=UPI003401E6DD
MEGTAQLAQSAPTPAPAAASPAPARPTGTPEAQARAALEAASKILRPYGFDATADLAEQKASRTQQTRTVVVVGEVKRGKSSLVNALVGQRDASPVGVDVTTSTTISFAAATPEHPAGTAELLFPGKSERIPHHELSDWVTVDGRHVRDARVETLPTRAIVPVEPGALGDVTVIDTPGIGGLDPSYAQLAVHSAQQACVLVVVCDATTPLTAPEMAFINDAAAAVDSVVLAVTKTDKNLRRWEPIVEENRKLLRKHLQRSVPVVGVSSLRAVAAAEMPPGQERERAEQASGITALRAEILGRLDMAEHLPAVDGLRTALGGMRKILDKIGTELAAVENGENAVPDLTAELEKLQSLKDHSQQWEQYLQRDLTLIRQKAVDELDRGLDEIRTKWTNRVNKSGMEVLRRNPQKFTAEMETDLHRAMAASMDLFFEQLYTVIVNPRFDSEVVWNEIYQQIMATISDRRIETAQVGTKRQGLLDPSMLTMGVMGSSMLGGLIGVSSIVGVGVVVGAVWVGVNLGFRAMRSGKANLLTWLRETIGTTKTTTARLLESATALSRPEIVIRYREHLRTRMEELQKQITDAKETARQDSATREKNIKRLNNNQRVVTARSAEIENIITRLTSSQGE